MSNGLTTEQLEDPGEPAAGQASGDLAGRLTAGAVPHLFRLFQQGRRSGTLALSGSDGRTATLWFRDGRIVDCQAGPRSGEAAVYDVLGWEAGSWRAAFGPVERPRAIALGAQALVAEGARRGEELARVAPRLPPRDRPLEIDFVLLSERLADLPDEVNGLLKLVDGRRGLAEVLADASADELAAAGALARLHAEGIVRPAAPPAVDWFAGPHGGDAAPAGEPVAGGAPRIVRFPARPPEASLTPALPVEALVDGPSGRRLPPEPPVEPDEAFDRAVPLPGALPAGAPPGATGAGAPSAAVGREAAALPTAGDAATPGQDARLLASAERKYLAGNLLGAVRDYQGALALRESSAALFGLGRALSGVGQPALAAEALARSAAIDARNADVQVALGEAYLADGRREEARRAYRRYLELAPTGELAADARAALARLNDPVTP